MSKPIRINLLPPELRKPARLSPLASLPWKRIGFFAGGLGLFLTVFLFVGKMQQSRALVRLTREWEDLSPQRRQLQELEAALEAMRTRERAVLKLKSTEARWAPRMDLLSEVLVADLWFQGMLLQMSREPEMKRFLVAEFADLIPNLDEMWPDVSRLEGTQPADPNAPKDPNAAPEIPWRPQLWLRGSALVRGAGQGEGAPVRRLIERLKNHPGFAQWFGGLELQDVGHEEHGAYEVSDFILILYPTGV